MGRAAAAARRGGRGLEFSCESRFVEMYAERLRDLYAPADHSPLVFVDTADGPRVQGLAVRPAPDVATALAIYAEGCAARDHAVMDLGPVSERAATVFWLTVRQTMPPTGVGQLATHLVSHLMVVDCPGAEKLGADPAVLRLREGVSVNRAIFSLGSLIKTLSSPSSAPFANYDDSMLTKLLGDALGGNCYTTLLATVASGEWELSRTTLTYAELARRVQNYPIVNHNLARGMLRRLREGVLQASARASRRHEGPIPRIDATYPTRLKAA